MRKALLLFCIISVILGLLTRLCYLQILQNNTKYLTEDPAIKAIYDYPERGYIYDRNNTLLVANQPAYDVMVIPRETKPLDTTEFCSLLQIDKAYLLKKLRKAKRYSPRLPSVVVPQLSKEQYAILQEKMRKYEGFYIQKRSLRHYLTPAAANVLGYISEVNTRDIQKNNAYQSGELIGRQGVEKQYETTLRGKKGVKYIQKDRFNRVIGSYKNGIYDTLPEQGKDIQITIDDVLQRYGEKLMQNKRGGIVALEPKTGEILALVSAPSYDPSLLVGRQRSKNYTKLYYDSIAKPTFDRGLLAMYPPGSPFKALNALIGLQEGVITPETYFTCHHGYRYGNRTMGCHCGGGRRNVNNGIYNSCNAYFANVYKRTIESKESIAKGMDTWSNHLKSFGLGSYLGYDLPIGRKGKIPNSAYYNRVYGEKRWYATFTISNAIGQGEILTTPMQLANFTAAIANRGYFYTPHILQKIEGKKIIDPHFTIPKNTSIAKEHFTPVIEGLRNVYESPRGTARGVRIPGITIAGKTGTAENFTKIDGKRVQLTDHSVFVAFAPVEDPKIALAVFIENGYWGSRWAGKIAGLMIEKYLKGSISRKDMENYILNGSLQHEYDKPYSGKPFRINE